MFIIVCADDILLITQSVVELQWFLNALHTQKDNKCELRAKWN